MRRLFLFSLIAFSLVSPAAARAQPTEGVIDIAEVRGLIDRPVADYILQRVEAAQDEGVQALILQMDSPGALDVDVSRLTETVRTAHVPVVVWVAPRGAEVDGAAAEIAAAADVLVAGPDTSAPETDARAASLRDLLIAIEGPDIEAWDEARDRPSATLRFQDMNVLAQVLHSVTSPEVALTLLLIGIFGLIFEAYNPGIGLAAIIGVASLALALYGLDALPTNWWGVLVIVGGIAALIYDVHIAGFGLATIAGLIAVAAGARLMFPAEPGAVALSWWGISAALVGTFVFFISVMTAALRVRLRRPVSDDDALIGTIGEAQTDIAPEGTVLTKGTVWRARTMETGIAAGQKVKVMASEGFVLLVEPVHHED